MLQGTVWTLISLSYTIRVTDIPVWYANLIWSSWYAGLICQYDMHATHIKFLYGSSPCHAVQLIAQTSTQNMNWLIQKIYFLFITRWDLRCGMMIDINMILCLAGHCDDAAQYLPGPVGINVFLTEMGSWSETGRSEPFISIGDRFYHCGEIYLINHQLISDRVPDQYLAYARVIDLINWHCCKWPRI